MFRVTSLIYNGNLTGYRLQTQFGAFDVDKTVAVKHFRSLKSSDSLTLVKQGDLLVTKGEDAINKVSDISNCLSLIKTLSYIYSPVSNDLAIKTGKDLAVWANSVSSFKKRYCFNDLMSGIYNNAITIVHGMRRTGKTVLLQQAVLKLLNQGVSPDKIAFITVSDKGLNWEDLNSVILSLVSDLQFDYVFVDEFTYVIGSVNGLNIFSDMLSNKTFVFSGTNSACFLPILNSAWFDRAEIIETSYISYVEFHSLYAKATVLDYIAVGGLLRSSKQYVQMHNWNVDDYAKWGVDYVGTALLNNIFHAFEYFDLGDRYSELSNLYFSDKNHLKTLLFKWVQRYASVLTESILNSHLFIADLGQYMSSQKNRSVLSPDFGQFVKRLETRYVEEIRLIATSLGTKAPVVQQEMISLMKELGCYLGIPDLNMVYVLPLMFRYGCSCDLVRVLHENFSVLTQGLDINFTAKDFADGMLRCVQGNLLESIVYIDLAKSGVSVEKFRSDTSEAEVDLILNRNQLYEIKLTSSCYPSDLRWLFDEEVINKYSPVSRTVLYIGETHQEYYSQREVFSAYVQRLIDLRGKQEAIQIWQEKLLTASEELCLVCYKNVDEFLIENTR